ncbi:MAG TPA: YggT family protein [Burkholderiales bacterium]|nr:YggT family protein [Burkholderiales bacterium]
MLQQILHFLIETLAAFFVYLLLARFHFQWLRVPFRNQIGEFVVATTNWIVQPARRVIPPLAGLDLASVVAAWLLQLIALVLLAALSRPAPGIAALAVVALVDLVRFSLYILSFAVVVQAILSWVNPATPLGPVFDALTRPFLRPLRRVLPPIANVDLSPLVLLIVLQVLLIPIWYLRVLSGGGTF